MTANDLKHVSKWFAGFVDGYRDTDGALHALLQLKVEHSARVAKDCMEIALELGWTDEDVALAEVVGILHDVGRFPQFRSFRTFIDRKSVDHGERGYEVVLDSNALSCIRPGIRERVLDGVRYHNRREIRGDLEAGSVRFLKLVRDADKLDIMFVVSEVMGRGTLAKYPELLLDAEPGSMPHPALVKEVRRRKSGSYEHVKTLADMNLMRMSWVYDMNYVQSLRRMRSRGLLAEFRRALPPDRELAAIADEIEAFVERKLGGLSA